MFEPWLPAGFQLNIFDEANVGEEHPFKFPEIEQMNSDGKYFIPYVVAYDGIAIIVNKSLGISNITIQQLFDIYSGKITSWNQIDSSLPKARIVPLSRDNASGTFEYFVEHVM